MTKQERRVIEAAMRFAKDWDVQYLFKGNRGRLARLVRACAALRAARKGKK